MPNAPGAGRSDNEQSWDWVHIDDFSPGIFDPSHISSEHPVTSQPLGAANAVGTFACAAIPGGALAPLPDLTFSSTFATINGGGFPGSATYVVLTGFTVTPQLANGHSEYVFIWEADDGANHFVKAESWQPFGPIAATITGPTETVATTGSFFGSPYPVFTRMIAGGTGNPPPNLVFPTAVTTDASGASGHLWVYPPPAARGTFAALDINSPGHSVTGQTIAYGSRVLVLSGLTYTWPAGSGVTTNENINFTDPPLSFTLPAASTTGQQAVLGAEIPWGYGAWGSVSVGELLLVKKYGGAVIVNGDIFAPTSVIEIPGVESTGNFVGSAAATPTGLYYCSQDRGAWVWNGGNTSTKISKALDDSFFDLETPANIPTNNYGFFCYHWQKWVMFSNNYMYDTETGAWWRIYPPQGTNVGTLTGRNIFWWALNRDGNQLLGAPLVITATSQPMYSLFDNTVPSETYQWTSLPIHVTKNADHVIDVRQIILRASDPSGSGTADVVVKILGGGSFVQQTATVIGTDPTICRLMVGRTGSGSGVGLQDITLQLLCTNGTLGAPAPTIHSIDIAYEVRAKIAVDPAQA